MREVGDVRKCQPQRLARERPRVGNAGLGVGDVLDHFAHDDVIERLPRASKIADRLDARRYTAERRATDRLVADVDAERLHASGGGKELEHDAVAASNVEHRRARGDAARDDLEARLQAARRAVAPVRVVVGHRLAVRRRAHHSGNGVLQLTRVEVRADQRAFQRRITHLKQPATAR